MTQAVNLANFANSLNSSGQLDPSNFSSAVPVSKGGTGGTSQATAQTGLDVPSRSGSGASGTWGINISGNAATATSATSATDATNAINATNATNATNADYATSAGNASTVTTITTSQVLSATASASVGAVGTYAWLGRSVTGTLTTGTTYAGSGLQYAGTLSVNKFIDDTAASINGSAPDGTWMCMGNATSTSGRYATSMFLRIS